MKRTASKIACIVLGAGSGIRYGGAKQLAKFQGKFLLQNALNAANASSADYVYLILGDHSAEILEKIQTGRAQVVFNRDYKTGIASSMKAGISNLPGDTAGAIIMVADQPQLNAKHLDLLIDKFRNSGENRIAALSQNSDPRNPVLIPRELFSALNQLQGDAGAREFVKKSDRLVLVEITDPNVFLDVDTKEALSDLANQSTK
ncbi:MAG: nucleotidyltransferase family protein [Thaumarchaeota archaeon]|nr:nucleotidyltransferase family protein [Nitrososphaerota archaeon]